MCLYHSRCVEIVLWRDRCRALTACGWSAPGRCHPPSLYLCRVRALVRARSAILLRCCRQAHARAYGMVPRKRVMLVYGCCVFVGGDAALHTAFAHRFQPRPASAHVSAFLKDECESCEHGLKVGPFLSPLPPV